MDLTDSKLFKREISQRFLFAMDRIVGGYKDKLKITAQRFGQLVGMTGSNLKRVRENPDDNFVTLEAAGRLCHHFKVSPAWLILNMGEMYANTELYFAFESLAGRLNELEDTVKGIQLMIRKG